VSDYRDVTWNVSNGGLHNWQCRTLDSAVTDLLLHLFIQLCVCIYIYVYRPLYFLYCLHPIYPQTGNRYDIVDGLFACSLLLSVSQACHMECREIVTQCYSVVSATDRYILCFMIIIIIGIVITID
jgi:hypothetical protein